MLKTPYTFSKSIVDDVIQGASKEVQANAVKIVRGASETFDLQSQQIVKYLKNEWNYPKNFEQAVIKQQNNMPYDFIDTPRHKLEVDFHSFRKHLEKEIN